MKITSTKFSALFLITCISMLVISCKKKEACNNSHTYTYYQPLYKSAAEVRANIKSNAAKAIVDPGKIYLFGNYIFLNEVNKGIHVIDNSNPAAPKNMAFIDIPGNLDIAVKGNTLYADFYTDLVALNISDPLHATVQKIVDNVFPQRYYGGYFVMEPGKVIYDWVEKTETVTYPCDDSLFVYTGVPVSTTSGGTSQATSSTVGISGSMARFALISDHLYTVSNDSLKVFNVTTTANPAVINVIKIGMGIETIFPFTDKLFIGSSTGMYVYSVQDPANPAQLSNFIHVRSCDPVIADHNNAYITLRSGTFCGGTVNVLEAFDISNIQSPVLITAYHLTNPRGLSKDGDLLFVCDGAAGLKIFNAADPSSINLIKQFASAEANDVIAFNKIALVTAKDGLYQYDYTDANNIKLLSKIEVKK